MQTVVFQTRFGPIPLTGVFGPKFKVLAITGAWAHPSEMSRLPHVVAPDFDGLVAALPGHLAPHLSQTSITAWAAAFDEVVEQLGPTLVLGLSVGALVALGMRAPVAIVAVEPPLSTGKLWPLEPLLTAALAEQRPFVETVFGYSEQGFDGRDYRFLADGLAIPTEVLVGAEPLFPQRPVEHFPSLVDEPERAFLEAQPSITLHRLRTGGHNVPFQAARAVFDILMTALHRYDPAAA